MPDTQKLMVAARTAALLDFPFWGCLSLRLKLVEDPTAGTAWTDGETLAFAPEFVEKLTAAQRVGLVCHEVAHVAHGHPWRRGDRDPRRWNIACDRAINGLLKQAGLQLPPGGLYEPADAGLSAEAIYSRLPVEPPGEGAGGEGEGEKGNDPGKCGGVKDPQGETEAPTEASWEVATLQAAMTCKSQGTLPAGMERLVRTIRKPACRDLVAALMEFVQRSASEDYHWGSPNRRYAPMGLYLPSLKSSQMPPIAAAVDTSGSISPDLLEEYVGALQTVLDETRPEKLTVISCDARVHRVAEYQAGDEISKTDYPGGGGTSFIPALEEIEKDDEVCVAIYLTDLDGRMPDKEPPFPVLWVVRDVYGQRPKPKFGDVIYFDE